jgi:hypothetical protein
VFGYAWARKSILPAIVAMGADKAYLKRITTLFAINVRLLLTDCNS